jgi:hypothetical protein
MPDVTSYRYTSTPDGEERCFFVEGVDSSWNSRYRLTGEADVVVATELGTPEEAGTEDTGTEDATGGAGA